MMKRPKAKHIIPRLDGAKPSSIKGLAPVAPALPALQSVAGERAIGDAVKLIMLVTFEAASRAGWWTDLKTGESIRETRNVGETLMLIVSEVAEAMEGHRKGMMDDKLPNRPMIEVELADALIRICDLAQALRLDLAGAVVEKIAYNATRLDHTVAARRAAGGKAY